VKYLIPLLLLCNCANYNAPPNVELSVDPDTWLISESEEITSFEVQAFDLDQKVNLSNFSIAVKSNNPDSLILVSEDVMLRDPGNIIWEEVDYVNFYQSKDYIDTPIIKTNDGGRAILYVYAMNPPMENAKINFSTETDSIDVQILHP
jgi:hypothetical protein